MKTLHLNLAARPYRDYRPLYAVVVVASLVIFFLMLNNVETGVRYLRDTKATRARIDKLEQQAANEEKRTRDLDQRLRTVDVEQLALQTQFANTQLAERAFSWSELLDRLERVLPGDVRIQSVTPSFLKSGAVRLNMDMWGKSGDSMVRTLDRFNRDLHFSNPFPSAEEHSDTGYHFGMIVEYKPSISRVVE
ncbi:MAG TPA: hypothetical protein VKH35_02720 [Thermoanaerobaculia bacterium]|nr:hypothetical protein [Thermoanaerobaculia bacterium]